MIHSVIVMVLFVIAFIQSQAKTISGKLSIFDSQPIKLEGFSGLKTYPISCTSVVV